MATLAHTTFAPSFAQSRTTTTWLDTYHLFIARSDFYRVSWGVAVLIIQSCLLSPILLLTMFYYGGGNWQFLVSFLTFLLVLIPFLSAISLRYILPAFIFSIILHLIIILINVLQVS